VCSYSADSDALYDRLLEGNRYWVDTCTSEDPNYFSKFKQGQRPAFLLIGCSDSRVAPDQLTATKPGEIFIHRNVANVIVNTDMNFMAVLQYAVEVLRVKHVIVMGHYGCGGVVAAMSNKTHGLIDKWLRNIKDVIRLHRHELQAIPDADLRCRRLVELNVQEQVYNIYKTSILQQAWAEGDKVRVHGWVYGTFFVIYFGLVPS
jgi:carbonic anhydrase